MSDALLLALFAVAGLVSLGFSWLLVSALERVGARLGLSESLLGMVAALAADAPEITAAIAALTGNHARIGAGVVLGSNVFNLAALLGLSALVAGRIVLHRRVIEMNGAVAIWIASVTVLVATGVLAAPAGLLAAAVVFAPYLALLGLGLPRVGRLRLPRAWTAWLTSAIAEEELELQAAIHPRRGGPRDAVLAAFAVVVVVGASVAMERSGAKLGTRHGVPDIVTGALVLAAVTSLPNAVTAVYLAARGRGTAVLSTALNSNAINTLAGLLAPGVFVGLGSPSAQTTVIAASYLALMTGALAACYLSKGLRRGPGALVVAAYLGFVLAVLAIST